MAEPPLTIALPPDDHHDQADNESFRCLRLKSQEDEDFLKSQLDAMILSEERKYQYSDYVGRLCQRLKKRYPSVEDYQQKIRNEAVNAECREKMVDWCFQFVDCAGFSRDVVFPTFFYLDQYLQTSIGSPVLLDRDQYRLATLCCFFIATKLTDRHSNNTMDLKTMRDVSQGQYNEEDFCEMELSILSALDWRVHPPSPLEFLPRFLALASNVITSASSSSIWHLAHLHCQVTIRSYESVTMKPSDIALSSIFHALNLLNIPTETQELFESTILKISGRNTSPAKTSKFETFYTSTCISPTTVVTNPMQIQ